MFVSTRRFDAQMDYMERQYKDLRDRYWKLLESHWELQESHIRLLEHLGVTEVVVPRKVVLVAKDVP